MVFSKLQKDKVTILNGRPFEHTGPPIVLYSDVFGQFIAASTDQTLAIPVERYKWTDDFLFSASQFYKDENQRRSCVLSQLAKLIGHVDQLQYGTGSASDGILSSKVDDAIAYRMIFELKKEMCSSHSEPMIQGSLYYHGYWSQKDVWF